MELTLAENPLHQEEQILTVEKVATLIGENGSGKSTILQSIFDRRLKREDYHHLRLVCFSSGQNENFSMSFSDFLAKERRSGHSLNLDCFYYDKSWSKILIFLSTALKREGKVRSFLCENNYVTESDDQNKDDISTELSISFKVDTNYVNRVKNALKQERSGEIDTLRSTPYFRSLESFISSAINQDYSFDDSIRKQTITITSNTLLNTSFSSEPINEEENDTQQPLIRNDPVVSFFTQAADNNYFIDKKKLKLTFLGGLELDQLSDGEYQLLFLYALIDLFDASNTLFLLDEADSHLHYKNVERLWKILNSIQGYAITTTHLLDSITANHFNSLKVVDKGCITETNKIKQLINRLSVLARAKSVEFEVCAKIPHMALLDDYNDWAIFIRLAARKGLDISQLENIQAIKKSSSYATTSENFGKAKLDWVKGLSEAECQFQTSKVFLICDRDEAALDFNDNGVTVNGQNYREQIRQIQWPRRVNVKVFLLAWKRREIKNYLLSYTALDYHGVLAEINNDDLAHAKHLKVNETGDNEDIRRMVVKPVIDPLINTEGFGQDMDKLQAYIDLIPQEEISEDIEKMYNFITENL